jgi:exonuclease III
MRIVSWNIWRGGRKRTDLIAAEFVRRAPDVVVLGEYMTGHSAALTSQLTAAGWKHHSLVEPPAHYGGVAVLSRHPLDQLSPGPGLEPFGFRYQAVAVPDLDLELRAIYAPLHNDPYREFWSAALDSLEADADRPVLVIGDLNMGATGTDSPAPDVFCDRYFRQLPGRGYSDLWRRSNGADTLEYTWHGQVNPYRLDHAFGSSSVVDRLVGCAYDHDVREAKLSDHSLMSVELRPVVA